MYRPFTTMLGCVLFLLLAGSAAGQTTITQWNFNSAPPDGSNSTGSGAPSTGTGNLSAVGGMTTLFASGSAGNGSSDPATTDNTGLGITNFPAQSTGNKTAGLQFSASTVGYTGIKIGFDVRPSNTSTRHFVIQYTTDVTAATPVWTDFVADSFATGDAFINGRSYNLSSVTALNNNANAGFRMMAAFRPGTTTYVAATTGGTWAASGNWRMDMVTISGSAVAADNTPPVAQTYGTLSSTTSYIRFSEAVASVSATNVANYTFSPSLAVSSAALSASGDTVFLTHASIIDGQAYSLAVANVQDLAGNTMSNASFNILYNASTPNLVITEIIHSPNDIESIEVYNEGATAVNLGGLKWTDGTAGAFPTVSLAAGATAVFATAPATTSSTLNVSPVYTITAGLGSSNDILVIRNSLNQVVDSVSYFVGTNGWPAAVSGVYAYSFELNNASVNNNLGSNWAVPVNTITPQPAAGTIRSTMGTYPAPAVVVPNGSVSFVGAKANVSESGVQVQVVAKLQNGSTNPSSIDLEVIPFGTATAGVDFTAPTSMQFSWAAGANNVNDTLTFTIQNDGDAEDAEYFIVRFKNPLNIDTPAVSSNNFTVFILDDDKVAPVATQAITLNHIGSFSNGAAGTNSAEIVAFDAASQRLFIANSVGGKLDVVNFADPASPVLIASISMAPYGGINSVTARNGIVAAAIENSVPENDGKIVFFDADGNFVNQVTAGAMPDMITFNHAGTKLFTANEGQPNTAYTVDPVGSVTIVDISGGVANVTQANVSTASFTPFNAQQASLEAAGVRIFGPGANVAQDLEPEYITISEDDQTAWVTCQENNAIAVIDIASSTVTEIRPLGLKDHSVAGNALDASDQGGVIQIANWPVKGIYMPDAISSYKVGGVTYLVTANEGDSREYNGYTEVARVGDAGYILDPVAFPYAAAVKANLGRLNVTTASGDTDGDGDFDEIHAYGGRSISIWNSATGALVWDSGDDMEQITSRHPQLAAIFNASNANNTLKNRSDDKGPEPEGVTVATFNGRTYAFVALERIGGCMVYDVTDPNAPVFVDYKNTRTIATYGGDQGAEGIIYISASQSPSGKPIVILANEVSSTLAFFEVQQTCQNAAITSSGGNTVCSGNPLTLTASAGSSYQWSTGATSPSITVSAAGTYSVIVTSAAGGCIDTASIVIRTIPAVSIASSASSVCDGASATLSLNNAANYAGFSLQWMNNNVAIAGATTATYHASVSGAYSLTVSDAASGACPRTSSVKNIMVKANPVADFSYTGNTVFCQGQSLTLNAAVQPSYSFRWLRDGIQVGTGATYMAKTAGIYTLTATLMGCTDTSSTAVSIGVNTLPLAMLTSADNDSFCSGSTITLDAAPASGSYQYEFTRGSASMGASASSSIVATDGGSYKVKITDLNTGCAATSAAYRIYSIATPIAHATVLGGNTNLDNGVVILHANYSPTITYQWTRNTVEIPGATSQDYTPEQSGAYRVVTTRGNLCSIASNVISVTGSNNALRQSVVTSTTTGFEITGYPNPVSDVLNVVVKGLGEVEATVQVLDMSGKVIATATMSGDVTTLDMSPYASGTYFVRYNDTKGNTGMLKVVKQ